jgi:hypothetical protein
MSIPVLIQVYDEMRRLAIAGSAVAAGDFRLKKLIEPLGKAGEKAPVFAKVGQAVQAVVDSNEKTASIALLELATLVNAILYTQGETGIAGELKPLESIDLGGQATQASARILKPLLEALTTTGSGRIELIRDAYERGTFKDLRLVKAAINAIDDPYPEIAELIAEKVLPLYGKAILPELRSKFDVKGRGGHLQRLRLMHQLDPQGSRELIQLALAEGSKEMKVVAIECLGTSPDDLAYLLEQAKAKAKDVRAAALRALTAANTSAADVVTTLKKAIAGPDLELMIARVKQSTLPEIQDYVLEQAEGQFAAVLKTKDKKEQGAGISRLQQLVSCLDERSDAKAEAFLLKCFDNAAALAAIKSEPSGSDLNELVAHVLSQGTPKMQQRLVAAHQKLTGGSLTPALYAARATMTAAKFYEEFSPLLKGITEKRTKKGGEAHDRGAALQDVLTSQNEHFMYRPWMHHGGYYPRPAQEKLKELDPRWLDAAVDAQLVDLVCELARPDHAATNRFLSEQLAKLKKPHESQEVLRTMVRIRHPNASDAVIAALKAQAKETSHYYLSYWYGRMIADLPASEFPKFEALLPTLPDKMVDQLMDSVLALKNKVSEA